MRLFQGVLPVLLFVMFADPGRLWGDDKSAGAQRAVERALTFLVEDAVTWRKERTCATCHHGVLTVWTLCEAQSRGYAVDEKSLNDMTAWTKQRLEKIDEPRDERPGWNMINTPALYLEIMSQTVPGQTAISREEQRQIAGHLVRHQEKDGSWAWSIAPAKNRPPPVFESDEVVTLLAYTVLGAHDVDDSKASAEARNSHEKGAAWLKANDPTDTTQAAAVRLFRAVQDFRDPRYKRLARLVREGTDALLARQNKDGGWGQIPESASDAYATGQSLYFLNIAGVPRERDEIQRGVSFLVASQKENGSWPMTSRAHPGEKPFTNPVPITYFGTAWATLGLARTVPK